MKKILIGFLFSALFAMSAFGQGSQTVKQSGAVTPGHPVMWTTNGVIQDAGTAAKGSLTSLGVTNNGGPGICVNSAATTAAYNQLCLSASTTSAAKITLQNYNSAAAQTIEFVVNGVIIPLPTIPTGAIASFSSPSITGDIGCFSNTTGLLTNCSTASLLTAGAGITLTGTTNVTIAQSTTAVTPGTYGSATACVTFTVDATGTLSGASSATCTPAMASVTNINGYIAALAADITLDANNDYLMMRRASDGAMVKVSAGTISAAATAGVATFNGRNGFVVPATNDYNFTQLAGSIAAAQIPNTTITQAMLNGITAWTNGTAGAISYTGGSVGIGAASPTAQLHTTGTVRFANYGAGCTTFDASGNLSSVTCSGLPTGGTISQTLLKNSGTNYDAGWYSDQTSVMAYGAKCDGATDDAAAFNSAFAAAAQVFLPPNAVCVIDSGITINVFGAALRGQGWGSKIKAGAGFSGTKMISIGASAYGTKIDNLVLDFNSKNIVGIYQNQTGEGNTPSTYSRIYFTGGGATAIGFQSDFGVYHLFNNFFNMPYLAVFNYDGGLNSWIMGNYFLNGSGVDLTSHGQAPEGIIIQNNIFLTSSTGYGGGIGITYEAVGGTENKIVDNIIDSLSGVYGIYVGNSSQFNGLQVINNWINNGIYENPTAGVHNGNWTIKGNTFPAGQGVILNNSYNGIVDGNTFETSSTNLTMNGLVVYRVVNNSFISSATTFVSESGGSHILLAGNAFNGGSAVSVSSATCSNMNYNFAATAGNCGTW